MPQSSTKVPHFAHGFLSVAEAAKRLGKSSMTVNRWCESGKLPAIPKAYGRKTTYLIAPATIDLYLLQSQARQEAAKNAKTATKPHSEYVRAWELAMAKGLMGGRVFSPHTIKTYKWNVDRYLKNHETVTLKNFETEIARIPVTQFSKRLRFYEAVTSFAKYLIKQKALDAAFLVEIKELRPKRHLPPKRETVTLEQVRAMIAACENEMDRAVLIVLVHTGLRASEFCALKKDDVDLQERVLTVRCGKGGKQRRVGLNQEAFEVLQSHLGRMGTSNSYVFKDANGRRMDRSGLYQRIERIGKKAGVKVSPHALRRAFVTINANAGRPLQMLQMACGHSDISTTMGYCRTSENELLNAMKDW